MFIISEFGLLSEYVNVYKLVNLSGDIITRITFSDKYKLPENGVYSINSYGRVCQKIRKKLESVGYINRNTGFDYMFKDNEIYITKIDLIDLLAQTFNKHTSKAIDMIDLTKYNDHEIMDIESQQALVYLPNLEKLNIGADVLSDKIWQLTKLRELELWDDSGQLSPNIGNLVNLIKLRISNCQITELPTTLGLLTKLTKLDVMDNNRLKYIPTEIGLLTNLYELIFNNCDIEKIPTEIFELTKLDLLNLAYNEISILPIELGKLINLTELMLSHNKFTSLPTEIGHLTKLQKLISRHCKLTNIPIEIGCLTNIITLKINNNNISILPSEIGLLKKMGDFCCYSNQLTGTIPDEIKQLSECMIHT